jgi:hypothetical protein
MRRRASLIACAALVLALSACGSARHATAPPRQPLTPRVAALRDPQTLLQRIAVPAGAEPAPELSRDILAGWPGVGVGAHRIYRVALPYRTVLRFFNAQHPRGATMVGGTTVDRVPGFGQNHEFVWSFRPIHPFLSSRRLHVTVVGRSADVTAVRIQVDDVWNTRPDSERVRPSDVRTISVHRAQGDRRGAFSARIADPEKVARVVHLFDALPLWTPSTITYFCPFMQFGQPTVIKFLSATGDVLAQAKVVGIGEGPCGTGISVSVGGLPQPPLQGTFLTPVLALAGVAVIGG